MQDGVILCALDLILKYMKKFFHFSFDQHMKVRKCRKAFIQDFFDVFLSTLKWLMSLWQQFKQHAGLLKAVGECLL
jgi:glutathionylspermidine synthase